MTNGEKSRRYPRRLSSVDELRREMRDAAILHGRPRLCSWYLEWLPGNRQVFWYEALSIAGFALDPVEQEERVKPMCPCQIVDQKNKVHGPVVDILDGRKLLSSMPAGYRLKRLRDGVIVSFNPTINARADQAAIRQHNAECAQDP